MTDQELKIRLEEMSQNNQRWLEDFKQRGRHWSIMALFWAVSVSVAVGAIFVCNPENSFL